MFSFASGISCFLSASSPPLGSIKSPLYISNSSSVMSLSSFGSSVKLSAALFLEFINLSDASQSLAWTQMNIGHDHLLIEFTYIIATLSQECLVTHYYVFKFIL